MQHIERKMIPSILVVTIATGKEDIKCVLDVSLSTSRRLKNRGNTYEWGRLR